ncbi:MAG: hypothetical protein AAFO01_15085, partial [Pseudomonadota bacterium]
EPARDIRMIELPIDVRERVFVDGACKNGRGAGEVNGQRNRLAVVDRMACWENDAVEHSCCVWEAAILSGAFQSSLLQSTKSCRKRHNGLPRQLPNLRNPQLLG